MTKKANIQNELYNFGLYSNQVKDLLLWHFDNNRAAADYFGVTEPTLKRWINTGSFPLSVIRLLLIMHRGYLPVSKEWRGFRIRGDVLYTPGGRKLTAYDLQELDIRLSLHETNVIQFRRKKKNWIKKRILKKRGLWSPP